VLCRSHHCSKEAEGGSITTPEVHNISQCRQRSTVPRSTGTKSVKVDMCSETDRQTDRQTDKPTNRHAYHDTPLIHRALLCRDNASTHYPSTRAVEFDGPFSRIVFYVSTAHEQGYPILHINTRKKCKGFGGEFDPLNKQQY